MDIIIAKYMYKGEKWQKAFLFLFLGYSEKKSVTFSIQVVFAGGLAPTRS